MMKTTIINIILVIIFNMFITGCTTVSGKKNSLFISNRLATVGYSFLGVDESKTKAIEKSIEDKDDSSWRKSVLHLAIPGWFDMQEATCCNLSLSPLFSYMHGVIHGIQVAPVSGVDELNGIQIGLLDLVGKGCNIQFALIGASQCSDGVTLAPLAWEAKGGDRILIGILSIVGAPRTLCSPVIGQLALLNISYTIAPRRGSHWQGGLYNFDDCHIYENEHNHSFQFGLWNTSDMTLNHDLKKSEKQSQEQSTNNDWYKRFFLMQLGLVNRRHKGVAGRIFQCGLVNKMGAMLEVEEEGFHFQFGIVNSSSFRREDHVVQIGLINFKEEGWSLFFNK
jgi:hypothetical protein